VGVEGELMLRHLRITNFAILSDVTLELVPGFNVLTGETGAGKSLIVDAVALLRGARARADIPRAGADEAVVEAIFEPPVELRRRLVARLDAAGIAGPAGGGGGGGGGGDGAEVVVRRVISRGGRSRVHVNGALTTVGALAQIGDLLVDLAGQHEHQGLVDVARHREILDAFGVDAALPARAAQAHGKLKEVGAALEAGEARERERAQREDFLRFQMEELEAAAAAPGEERALAEERERLRSAGKLVAAARRAEEELYAREGAAVDVLGGVARELEGLVGVDARLAPELAKVKEAQVLLGDATAALRRYAETVGAGSDPERLTELDERLHLLGRLARKHGPDLPGKLAQLRAEVAELQGAEARTAELRRDKDAAWQEGTQAARALTEARRKAGRRLARAAGEALAELGMAGARLDVRVEDRPGELGPHGWDRVELMLGANPGEEPRPLHRIASGGELSRVMLALKLSLEKADPVAAYVFDEVDAGIGGATAEVVGRQIRRVADARQVICVTHLPQIAALADAQFRVEKYTRDGRTETSVVRLAAAERREEIARMLGGIKITPRTRAHAEEMLKRAAVESR
jgi:DNA repair protein RecN (Recombination protein N)